MNAREKLTALRDAGTVATFADAMAATGVSRQRVGQIATEIGLKLADVDRSAVARAASKQPKTLKVHHVAIDFLQDHPDNPRLIGEEEKRRLRAIIVAYGLVEPLCASRDRKLLLGGHQRRAIARELGYKTIPVTYAEDAHPAGKLTDAEVLALMVALNNPGAQGEWSTDPLRKIIDELQAQSFDMSVTGFDDRALHELLNDSTPSWLDLGDAPAPVVHSAEQLKAMKDDRKAAGRTVQERDDTERYLIVVFPSRAHREKALADLGCEIDERYLAADDWRLVRRRRDVKPQTGPKVSDSSHTGAAGGFV